MEEAKGVKKGRPSGTGKPIKAGEDLRVDIFLSKPRRKLLEDYYLLKNHRRADEEELRGVARQVAYGAIETECIQALSKSRAGSGLSLTIGLAETTTTLFTQYFRLKYGYEPTQSQLESCARQIFERALESEMVSEFEKHQPGTIFCGGGEVF